MTHTPHELHEMFPDKQDRLHKLKVENHHFTRIADEYHKLNRAVHRAETEVEPLDDFHLEEIKKKRLKLLDEISAMLGAK